MDGSAHERHERFCASAEDSVNGSRAATACNEMGAFITEVQADIKRGALTQTEGQSLIDAAGNLRVALGCP